VRRRRALEPGPRQFACHPRRVGPGNTQTSIDPVVGP
jgi:hypothetical protein